MSKLSREIVRRKSSTSRTSERLLQHSNETLEAEQDDCEVQAKHVLNSMNRCLYICSPLDAKYNSNDKLLDRMEAKINLTIIMWAHRDKVQRLLSYPSWYYNRDKILFNIDRKLQEGRRFEVVCEIIFRRISEHGWVMQLFQVAPWGCASTVPCPEPATETQKEDILLSIIASSTASMRSVTKEKPGFEKVLDREYWPELVADQQDADRRRNLGILGVGRNKSMGNEALGHPKQKKRVFLPRWEGDWGYKRSLKEDELLLAKRGINDDSLEGPLLSHLTSSPTPLHISSTSDDFKTKPAKRSEWSPLPAVTEADDIHRSLGKRASLDRKSSNLDNQAISRARPKSEEAMPPHSWSTHSQIDQVAHEPVSGKAHMSEIKKVWKGKNLFPSREGSWHGL